MKEFGLQLFSIRDHFENEEQIKEAFLEIKKYGYDGIVFLAATQGPWTDADYERLAAQGYDATYAYHWSARGEDEAYQIKCNKNNFDRAIKANTYHIPTISIGFNDVGRNETRDPIVDVSGHYKVCTNAKKLIDALDTGTWKDNTVFLSTWNEYSEGTYMFPTESTGFDYLENVREVFTKDKTDHSSIDVRPTESQIDRVTHLYPENHSPIRWYQFEVADYGTMEYNETICPSPSTHSPPTTEITLWSAKRRAEDSTV